MALYLVALLFGTHAAETILASVRVRAHQQAGHMGASDLIKALQKHLARRGPSTYGSRPFRDVDFGRWLTNMVQVFGRRPSPVARPGHGAGVRKPPKHEPAGLR
jgi:hypothetical protein